MSAMHYRLNEDFVASDMVRWYDKASLGDTVYVQRSLIRSRPLYLIIPSQELQLKLLNAAQKASAVQ